jgi:hypothetical protein
MAAGGGVTREPARTVPWHRADACHWASCFAPSLASITCSNWPQAPLA